MLRNEAYALGAWGTHRYSRHLCCEFGLKRSLRVIEEIYLHTATVLIMTAVSANPQPITIAPGLRWFWKEAPRTTKPQM
jgi:hypothetical protein